jgi:hypothetical protein
MFGTRLDDATRQIGFDIGTSVADHALPQPQEYRPLTLETRPP